jgi:hypothetical protein
LPTPNTIYLEDADGVVYLLGVSTALGPPQLTQTVVPFGSPTAPPVYVTDGGLSQTYQLGINTAGDLTLTDVSAQPLLQVSNLLLQTSLGVIYIVTVVDTLFNINVSPIQPAAAVAAAPPATGQGQLIPLDNAPNQTWQVSVSVNGAVQTFFVILRYNEIAGYWAMTIEDSNQNLLVDSLPLLTGLNLLRQFQSLQIGSVFILNVSGVAQDSPDNTDLGSDFQMIWANNRVVPVAA